MDRSCITPIMIAKEALFQVEKDGIWLEYISFNCKHEHLFWTLESFSKGFIVPALLGVKNGIWLEGTVSEIVTINTESDHYYVTLKFSSCKGTESIRIELSIKEKQSTISKAVSYMKEAISILEKL